MTAIGFDGPLVKISLPSRKELRAMLSRPSVFITAIICVTVVVLAALVGVVLLTINGYGSEAFSGLAVALLGLVLGRVQSLHTAIKSGQSTDAK